MAVIRPVLLAVLVFALAGCGDSAKLASVGDRSISRAQVDKLVEHAREEAEHEGADFPAKGSDGYRALEQEALAMLVTRAQVEQAAGRLGVAVSQAELDRQVAVPGKDGIEKVYESARRNLGIPEASEKGTSAALLADAVRVQLTLQKVERKLGRDRVAAWYAQARKTRVDYADGWGPAGLE